MFDEQSEEFRRNPENGGKLQVSRLFHAPRSLTLILSTQNEPPTGAGAGGFDVGSSRKRKLTRAYAKDKGEVNDSAGTAAT